MNIDQAVSALEIEAVQGSSKYDDKLHALVVKRLGQTKAATSVDAPAPVQHRSAMTDALIAAALLLVAIAMLVPVLTLWL